MRKQLIVLALAALLLASCAAGKSAEVESMAPAPWDGRAVSNYAGEMDYAPQESAVSYDQELAVSEAQIRMVIKDASLSIVVEDPGATMQAITSLAEDLGGYVVTSNLYRTQTEGGLEVPQANITLRVPADKLDQALEVIKSGAGQVLSENVSGQDVTQEYTDLDSRLRNLERAEAQLADIMEQARQTDDVLTVYNRLVEVREQIEVIKGQMLYYERSAAMSSISVYIQANEAVQPLKIGNWQPVGVAKKAIQALINTLKTLANILIWIALYMLPVAAILYFPARWLWKGIKTLNERRKERRARRKAAKSKEG
ncbi:MAG: DUF4349 domain-containing protein [Anaerolineales bacterium]|jgi:hypothetical protein